MQQRVNAQSNNCYSMAVSNSGPTTSFNISFTGSTKPLITATANSSGQPAFVSVYDADNIYTGSVQLNPTDYTSSNLSAYDSITYTTPTSSLGQYYSFSASYGSSGSDACNVTHSASSSDTQPGTPQASDEAAVTCESGTVTIKAFKTIGGDCVGFQQFFGGLLNYFLLFSSIIAGIMFVRGAFKILVSRGSPSALNEGKDTLTSAIIGLILIGTAFALINFLGGAFQFIDGSIDLTPIGSSK